MKRVIQILMLSALLSSALIAQPGTPTLNGTVSASEYNDNNSGNWFMTWDDEYLYIAKIGGTNTHPIFIYLDINPIEIVNAGSESDGSRTGTTDWSVTPNLPFRADAMVYWRVEDNFIHLKNANGSGGWGSGITNGTDISMAFSGTNREMRVRWAAIDGLDGKPESFLWIAYQVDISQNPRVNYHVLPSSNPSVTTNTPTFRYYDHVVTTSDVAPTKPFTVTSYASRTNNTIDVPTTLRDLTINSGATVTLGANVTVNNKLIVNNGDLRASGARTLEINGDASEIRINNSSGGVITGTDAGAGNDLSLNITSGETLISGDATSNNDHEKKFFNVTVSDGATLALSRGILVRYGTFSVAGTLKINSNGYVQTVPGSSRSPSYNAVSGRLIYNNGGTYTSAGEWPSSNSPSIIDIQNGSVITLTSTRTLNTLNQIDGDLVVNGSLTLSEWNQNTGILRLGDGGSIATSNPSGLGTATLSRQITGDAGWRLLSAPVQSVAIGDVTNLLIQGYGDGFQKNFYLGWNGTEWVAPSDLTGNLTAGQGFIWYYFANNNNGYSIDPTLSVSGDAASDVSVALNAHSETATERFTLVGNPYGYNVNVANLIGRGAASQAVVQTWEADPEEINGGSWISSSTHNNRLAVWQAAVLETNVGQTHVFIPNLSKTEASANFYKENEPIDRLIGLTLRGTSSDGTINTIDRAAILYFHNTASMEWDRWDASKFIPMTFNNATIGFIGERDGAQVLQSQLSLPFDLSLPLEIPVDFSAVNMNGTFRLSAEIMKNIPDAWGLVLVDNFTGEQHDLRNDGEFVFTHNLSAKINPEGSFEPALGIMSASNDPRFTLFAGEGVTTSVDPVTTEMPLGIHLSQNYPNPFNPTTMIRYQVAENGQVSLRVFDMLGREVASLVNGTVSAGSYDVSFDASSLSSGVYIYRLEAGGQVLTRKMTMLK